MMPRYSRARPRADAHLSTLISRVTRRVLRPASVGVTRRGLCPAFGTPSVSIVFNRRRLQDFVGHVIAMLAGVKYPPPRTEGQRQRGAEQAEDRRIAVRDVEARDIVVPIVLEPGSPREGRIDRRRWIASLRKDPQRNVDRVICGDVEHVGRVEQASLGMKSVTSILDENDVVAIPERHVVKPGVSDVAVEKERQ